MLKITTIEGPQQRVLLLEGELTGPWINELRAEWIAAQKASPGRITVNLNDATVISPQGVELLLEMKKEGAKFTCDGIFMRHVLRQVARACGGKGKGR